VPWVRGADEGRIQAQDGDVLVGEEGGPGRASCAVDVRERVANRSAARRLVVEDESL
jgi:hypothetical protein